MEPRAGFDPATNSLRGCRSTGLSHRGVCSELSEIRIFKTFGRKQPTVVHLKIFYSVIEIKMCLCIIRWWVATASTTLYVNLNWDHPFMRLIFSLSSGSIKETLQLQPILLLLQQSMLLVTPLFLQYPLVFLLLRI